MGQESIAAVVVTYNRSELLMKCLESIVNQTCLPDALYIIDNRSTDGTRDILRNAGFINEQEPVSSDIGDSYRTDYCIAKGTILVNYVYKNENDGGAGGFYAGMVMAYKAGYDWLWMMDDDGYADSNQLLELVDKSRKYGLDYANALVLWNKNPDYLAFSLGIYKLKAELVGKECCEGANPFNGTFIHRPVIAKVGFVKKELFIWGDETDYLYRVQSNHFKLGTICTAIHYHPLSKGVSLNVIPFINQYHVALPNKKRAHIFYRNLGYLYKTYFPEQYWKLICLYTIAYGWRFKFGELFRFYVWYARGGKNDFAAL